MKKNIAFILSSLLAALIILSVGTIAQADTTAVMPVPINPACKTITSPLYEGITGQTNEVAALQAFLSSQGYFHAQVSGYFGSVTAAAVKSYQGEHGLPSTGYVGPLTIASLNQFACVSSTAGNPMLPAAASFSVFTPAAGTTWQIGKNEIISWQGTSTQAVYDLALTSLVPPCASGQTCNVPMIRLYPIIAGLSARGNYPVSYAWNVGSTTQSGMNIPAGQYNINVCIEGSSCAYSGSVTLTN